MLKSEIDCHIHFKHRPAEIQELDRAIIPMQESIVAVATSAERQKMRLILGCQYFRARHAGDMVAMLLRACKYTKMHLCDFFPIMRAQILDNTLALEEAAIDYRDAFESLKNETVPTP